MKTQQFFLFLLLPFILFTACQNTSNPSTQPDRTPVVQTNTEAEPIPATITQIAFEETLHRFGEVPKDVPVKHRFTFRNTGTTDLVIESAKPQCGCTATNYTKEAVKPGETGYVEAEFNAKAVGIFKKSVTVTANTDPRNITLNFEGEVVE